VRKSSSCTIFENIEIGSQNQKQHLEPVATLCRPNSKNRKTGLKLNWIKPWKREKKASTVLSKGLLNWGWAFVFNKASMPGGILAEVRRQRVAKNRESPIGLSGEE
jgi:hypothetical protein